MFRYLAALVLALGLAGCAPVKIDDYRDTAPALVLEEYFAGPVRAWGIVQDRSGKVRRRFTVDMHGAWEGDTFVLDEEFVFADGERMNRTWRIRRIDAHHYEGTAGDIVGVARGRAEGMALHWRYTLELEVGDREVEVDFDDWLFAHEDGVVINRATMRKFGFRVGELTVFFRKLPAGEAS
ncbi:MAG: DUF3833 domain-containing protein [Gammaproteobacteria bacterium]|nr:DUF3833 domain-containing protein [Gammaproteobacteria bacterium]